MKRPPLEQRPPRPVVVRFASGTLTARRAGVAIALMTLSVTLVGGLLVTLVDQKDFPTLGRGMWWAVQTVTTVGYGDVTPAHLGGRLVGVAVMLEGVAFIAIVTAVITSTFVARATRESEAARTKNELSDRELIEKRFDEFEHKLDAVAARIVDGH